MKVTIYGSGYVGLVTAACLASVGHEILCVDVDAEKIAGLKKGVVPIYEPKLDGLVKEGAASGLLRFSTDMDEAANFAQLQMIAVGTPSDEDGSADLSNVLKVAATISGAMQGQKIVVCKSTVPVGTADKVREKMSQVLKERGSPLGFDVVSNPEFLKEGAAVDDFLRPDRIIIGSNRASSIAVMKELYAPFSRNHEKSIIMDNRSAELTKYASNAMLAAKISFMNELAELADKVGVDIEKVRHGIGADSRIGHHFIYPGVGYGGSCFPKDIRALLKTAGENGVEAGILAAVEERNARQKNLLFAKIYARFGGDLDGKTIALWGLAFKPETDDMREAPSRDLMESLWQNGAGVQAFDPVAGDECRRLYGNRNDLMICDSAESALDGADALAIVTDWNKFRTPNFDTLQDKLKSRIIFDGRNLYSPLTMAEHGFEYHSIGRPMIEPGQTGLQS